MSVLHRILEWAQREGGDLLGQTVRASGEQAKGEGERDDRDGLTDNDSGKRIARLVQEKDAAIVQEAKELKADAEKRVSEDQQKMDELLREKEAALEMHEKGMRKLNYILAVSSYRQHDGKVAAFAAKGETLTRQSVAAKNAAKDRSAGGYFENKARIEREGPKARPRQPDRDRGR